MSPTVLTILQPSCRLPKCISHYSGAYQKLVSSGRTVLLVIEEGHTDSAVAEFVDNAAGPTVPPEGIRLVVP